MADNELARKVAAALAFSGRPVLFLYEPVITAVKDTVTSDGALSGTVLATLEAALRAEGKRYTGRILARALACDVVDSVIDGRRLVLAATGVTEDSQLGPLINWLGGYTPPCEESHPLIQEFRELTADRTGAALYAELTG